MKINNIKLTEKAKMYLLASLNNTENQGLIGLLRLQDLKPLPIAWVNETKEEIKIIRKFKSMIYIKNDK